MFVLLLFYVFISTASLSSAENSTALENQTPGLDSRSLPHLPAPQLTATNNINGNASQNDVTLPKLDIIGKMEEEEEDIVPGTPPNKKGRFLFRRCFESTFNPKTIPGHDRILAEDSDDDS